MILFGLFFVLLESNESTSKNIKFFIYIYIYIYIYVRGVFVAMPRAIMRLVGTLTKLPYFVKNLNSS